MIVFNQGLRGSVTQAWSGKTSIGVRRFTNSVTRGVKTRDRRNNLPRLNQAPVGFHSRHFAAADPDSDHLRVLMDLNTPPVGGARVAPGHGIVTGDGPRRMKKGSLNRQGCVRSPDPSGDISF